MPWDDIIKDPSFQEQDISVKRNVAENYFKEVIAVEPTYQEQPFEVQDNVLSNFLSTVEPSPTAPETGAIAPESRAVRQVLPQGAGAPVSTIAPPVETFDEQARPHGLDLEAVAGPPLFGTPGPQGTLGTPETKQRVFEAGARELGLEWMIEAEPYTRLEAEADLVAGDVDKYLEGAGKNLLKAYYKAPQILARAPFDILGEIKNYAAERIGLTEEGIARKNAREEGKALGPEQELINTLGGWLVDIAKDPLTHAFENPQDVAFAVGMTRAALNKSVAQIDRLGPQTPRNVVSQAIKQSSAEAQASAQRGDFVVDAPVTTRPAVPARTVPSVEPAAGTSQKLSEAVGKPKQPEVLERIGVKGEEAKIEQIVRDEVKSKMDAAEAFRRRGDVAEATRLEQEAFESGRKLKEADGLTTEKAVDSALRTTKIPAPLKSAPETVAEVETSRQRTQARAFETERPPQDPIQAPGDVAAGGLSFGQKLPKYAGGNIAINLERVGGDYSAKKFINDIAGEYKGEINEARRGQIKQETTKEMADNLGMTVDELLARKKGQAFNAEESLAARDILASSAKKTVELRKIAAETNSDVALVNFRMALEQHALIQAEVSGIATEAGRALAAHRIRSRATESDIVKNYKAMLEALGGREVNEVIAERMKAIDPSNQVAVNRFIRDVTKATTGDMIYEAWINALLSSPKTHIVNIVSNSLTALSGFAESAVAAGIDFISAKATGRARERFFGEAPWKIYGATEGLKEGVRKGIWSFVNEMPTEGISKLEVGRTKAIKGLKGELIRTPGRFLIAADEFFKAVNYVSETHGLSYRRAAAEGKKGRARAERMAEILENPPEELKSAAREEMLYRVFQSDLGPISSKISQARRHYGLRYIVPFIRTPANIVTFGLQRTPLNYGNILRKALKGDLKGGEISTELGKATVGSLIGAGTFMYAMDGEISGRGPDDRNERAALQRTGWQPYSVKIGNRWYSYGRFEPIGMVMGLAADSAEIWEEMDNEERQDVATLIVKAITQNLTSKTWLRGIGDLMNAVTDPNRYGETWTQRFAGTVVPAGVSALRQGLDPNLRRVESILDKVRSRLPIASKALLPRLDLWGEPIRYGGSPMSQVFSPVYVSDRRGDKIDNEILRLEMFIGLPGKKLRGKKLTPEQHNEYVRRAGQSAKQELNKLVESQRYRVVSDEVKAKLIRKTILSTRKRAGNSIMTDIRRTR